MLWRSVDAFWARFIELSHDFLLTALFLIFYMVLGILFVSSVQWIRIGMY